MVSINGYVYISSTITEHAGTMSDKVAGHTQQQLQPAVRHSEAAASSASQEALVEEVTTSP
jgi:hypothetical protein